MLFAVGYFGSRLVLHFLLLSNWYLESDFNKISNGNCDSGTNHVPCLPIFPCHV